MIRLGRSAAVGGHVRDALEVFTSGIGKFPADARFYRHRGHRYVTVREFDKAIADLTKASQLIAGKPDEPEPSTADPSVMSSETLHYAIYYHLGLAHYLKGDFARALPVYRQCLAVAKGNDDQTAGASDWLYMTLRRLGRADEAAKVLEPIVPGMKIKDDQQYYDRLFMYKGLKTPDDLLRAGGDPVSAATLAYGVANWHLYNGRKDEAKALFENIITGPNWMPFGFIAAEAELARMTDARVNEPSLVARLQQFIKDNPTSPKLETVYSSLLSAAARDADPDTLLAIADEVEARFPESHSRANDVTNAMTTFRQVKGETAAKALAQKLIETETNPGVLLSAAKALPAESPRLLEKAIALRRTVDSATAFPTLEDLTWAYVEALDRAGRRDESARLQKEVVEYSRKRIAELDALPKDDPARSSLPLLRASLANRYFTLARQAVSARQYERALEYVKLSEESDANSPLEFATRYDEQRAAIYAAMKRPDLELESWVKVFANCMEIRTRDRIRELAVRVGRKPEEMLQRARDIRARSARPVAGFELKTVDGPPLSLASLTSKNKVTLFTFFFPT